MAAKRTQTVFRPARNESSDPVKRWEWRDADKTPHWLRYGKGYARLEFIAHSEAGWVSFEAAEHGDKSGKRVMATLDVESVRDMHAFLGQIIAAHEAALERNRVNNTPRDGA